MVGDLGFWVHCSGFCGFGLWVLRFSKGGKVYGSINAHSYQRRHPVLLEIPYIRIVHELP